MNLQWEPGITTGLKAKSERYGRQRCALYWMVKKDHDGQWLITADRPLMQPGQVVKRWSEADARAEAQRLETELIAAWKAGATPPDIDGAVFEPPGRAQRLTTPKGHIVETPKDLVGEFLRHDPLAFLDKPAPAAKSDELLAPVAPARHTMTPAEVKQMPIPSPAPNPDPNANGFYATAVVAAPVAPIASPRLAHHLPASTTMAVPRIPQSDPPESAEELKSKVARATKRASDERDAEIQKAHDRYRVRMEAINWIFGQ
jgi:hypothetical protein